jgi:hypothetical protein
MGFTTQAQQKILNAVFQAAALGAPATFYVGILTAKTWASGTVYTAGSSYVIPVGFNSLVGQTGCIFKCTTGGTSGGAEPTWPTTVGGTVNDNGVIWTEVSDLFQQGTFTNAEVTGSGYARVAIAASSGDFNNATNAQPAVTSNAVTISFPTPGVDWGLGVGFLISDASTAGNYWSWGVNDTALDCSSGSAPAYNVTNLQLQMTP